MFYNYPVIHLFASINATGARREVSRREMDDLALTPEMSVSIKE